MKSSERSPANRGWRAVGPAQRPVLFINPASGDGTAVRLELAVRAREHGIEPIVLAPGQDLAALAQDAVADGADALGMAGGDGSLVVVAAVARAHELPFVCVPAGTRNHFALDLGVARHDVIGALDAFSDGLERWIDVAEVNGRIFLNNASLGIYGDAVQRAGYRNAKVRTLLETAQAVLGPSAAARGLELVDELGREHTDPAVVLVSNNPYALDRPLARGTRPRLDGGELGIVVLDRPSKSGPGLGQPWSAPTLEVSARSPVHVGLDGEAVTLNPPLQFAIRPGALHVRISSRHPGVSPSARLIGPRYRSARTRSG